MQPNHQQRLPVHKRVEAGYRMSHRSETGEKVTEISEDLGISRSALYSLENKYAEDPSMADKPRGGRPAKVDERLERRIIREIHRDPFQSSVEISNNVNMEIEEEKKISPNTVKSVAHQAGYSACRPLLKPPLNVDQKAARLNFCQIHQNKTMHFWRNVIFMDETYIRYHPRDSRKRVWRQEGERLAPEHILPAFKFGGGGVMFWGCISWMGVGPLIAIYDNLEGDGYARILRENIPQVKADLNVMSAYFIEDHSRVHGTYDVLRAKEDLQLNDLDLPTYSPDLNILENLWAILKTRVAQRACETEEELEAVAQEVWTEFTIDDIRTYFYSIPNRIADIISSEGGYSKY